MTTKKLLSGLMVASLPFLHGCKGGANAPQSSVKQAMQDKAAEANSKKIDELNHDFSRVPDEQILDDGDNTPLYSELKQRYKNDLAKLKGLVEATGAKLVFIGLTPEIGHSAVGTKYGMPYIKSICSQMGIEFIDFAPILAQHNTKEITQWPHDGHWSKKGAALIAGQLAPVIKKYSNITSTVTYKDSERPETFGDFTPSSDEIQDGGKDLPYHVKANAQGVRMDEDIKFPKKKKHVLFMGDSGIFCPFLNNEFTITGVLQQQMPDMVMMNTGVIGYTIEDYVTLWNDKAKYSEPDIVFVQTDGGDITDYYFTHRNHLSRSHKPFLPSATEEAFYKKHYPTN